MTTLLSMILVLQAASFMPALNSRPSQIKPLPARARITVKKAHLLDGYPKDPCPDGPPLTTRQLRHMFRTYHEVIGVEHEGYMELGCVTEGNIFVDGTKFITSPNQSIT